MASRIQDAPKPNHHLPWFTPATFISTGYVSPYSIPKDSPYASGNSAMPTTAQTPPVIKFRVTLSGGAAQHSATSSPTSSRVSGQANPPAASPQSTTAGLWYEWYAKWINRFWKRLRQEGIDLQILPYSCGEVVTPSMIASTNVADPAIALVHYLVSTSVPTVLRFSPQPSFTSDTWTKTQAASMPHTSSSTPTNNPPPPGQLARLHRDDLRPQPSRRHGLPGSRLGVPGVRAAGPQRRAEQQHGQR